MRLIAYIAIDVTAAVAIVAAAMVAVELPEII